MAAHLVNQRFAAYAVPAPRVAGWPGAPREPVLDPAAEGDEPGHADRAGAERLERHDRGHRGDGPSR